MTAAVAGTGLSIDIGQGQAIELSDHGDGRWLMVFKGTPAAPPLSDIKVEAISHKGQVAPLRMFPGETPGSVFASGPIETAYRARVTVQRGPVAHTRDVRLPAAPGYEVITGPRGGTLISMGHDSYVEVVPSADGHWQLTFMENAARAKAPPTADVKAEAIAEACRDDQVRVLDVVPGADASTLVAVGPVADATYLRLAVMMGDHYHTRCVPVGRA